MPCSAPPPLSDDAISAALDGIAPEEVDEHLQQCPGCAARMEHAREIEQRLVARLYRWDCPSASQLGDYHAGMLAPEQQHAVAGHLARCVRCGEEVKELRAFLADEAVPVAPPAPRAAPRPSRFQALIARLLPPAPELALAGVRGAGAGAGPLIAQCSAATIVLAPEHDERGMIRLSGQIADEAGEQGRWDGALVEMRQGGDVVATAFVDDLGGFRCGPLPPGATELRITPAVGPPIVIEGLEL